MVFSICTIKNKLNKKIYHFPYFDIGEIEPSSEMIINQFKVFTQIDITEEYELCNSIKLENYIDWEHECKKLNILHYINLPEYRTMLKNNNVCN